MGDMFVSALVSDMVSRLTSLALQEFSLLWGLKHDISSLKDDFEQIQAVLQDAEEKHVHNNAVALWLQRLRSASLEVENVLDEVSTEALLQRLHKRRVNHRVRAFFSFNHNKYMCRVRIAHKVKDIRRKLNDIASKRFELNLTPSIAISHVDDMGVAVQMPDRETSSRIHDSSIILGRNEETDMVIGKICNKLDIGKHENAGVRVYGIWGMGGVGKTTLAQLVYNHETANQYFDLKCWVHVSENFQVKEIMKKLIESIDKCKCKLTQLETLQESLQTKLGGKKFLIVLDDVWIEYNEKDKWDQLSEILSCGAEGSIILTTTRSHTTSRMMAKIPELQHEPGCLSKEDAWELFARLAFEEGREGDDISELEPIGREIVEKCKGLPLAVKSLGGLMWLKSSIRDWQCVNHSNIWELHENNILPALKLSYDNLRPHLRRCFAYCCLLPKGYEMEKDELIALWLSNDFVPSRGGNDLYMLGEEIFNCLVWRSFFILKETLVGDRYVMHDLMHDMARHVMGDDCLVIEPGTKDVVIPDGVLHLSSSCPDFHFSPQDLEKLTSLRSIFMFGEDYKCNISQIFNHVRLRVLFLCGVDLNILPESVRKLKHLKYLNLSTSSIEVLGESIIYLQNLQMLLLKGCMGLEKLPKGLRYMRNLQCLDLTYCFFLIHMPRGIEELSSLRRLSRFRLNKSIFPFLNNNVAKIGELGNLNLLEGVLEIDGLECVEGLSEAKSANLKCKTNLSVLALEWSDIDARESTGQMFTHDEAVLEGLEPISSLKGLSICYYTGKIISPSWMINLKNLVEIKFFGCKKCEDIPALRRLPNLRVIDLSHMDSLECFHDDGTDMSGDTTDMFHSLQKLDISNCPVLNSLPSNLPKLEVLLLCNCNKLVSLPDEIQSFKNMKKLVIEGCELLRERYEKEIGVDWHKISHIPDTKISA